MEKLAQLKSKFLKFLPRQPVASMAFRIQNPTLSPSGSVAGNRSPSHVVSIIPKEARRKLKSSSFSAREPTSPKVSCMGEVKCKKKKKMKKRKAMKQKSTEKVVKKEKMLLWIFKISGESESDQSQKQNGKALVLKLEEKKAPPDIQNVPSLGTMKKFASGRGTLSGFDIKVEEL